MSALTLRKTGWRYDVVVDLLWGEWETPALPPRTGDAVLLLDGLARRPGRSTTEGLHQRVLPLPEDAAERWAEYGVLAQARVRMVQQAARALIAAVGALGWPEVGARWADRLHARFDEHFFDRLWGAHRGDVWGSWVVQEARVLLEEAIRELRLPAAARRRARPTGKGKMAAKGKAWRPTRQQREAAGKWDW